MRIKLTTSAAAFNGTGTADYVPAHTRPIMSFRGLIVPGTSTLDAGTYTVAVLPLSDNNGTLVEGTALVTSSGITFNSTTPVDIIYPPLATTTGPPLAVDGLRVKVTPTGGTTGSVVVSVKLNVWMEDVG